MSERNRLILLLAMAGVLAVVAGLKHGRWLIEPSGGGDRAAAMMPMPELQQGPARELVETIRGFSQSRPDTQRLRQFRETWPPERVHPLLKHDEPIVRQCAVIALMNVGDRSSVPPLVDRLRDRHRRVRMAADRALWRVWYSLGSVQSNRLIDKAKKRAGREDFEGAILLIDKAIEHEPGFAEAYNQRAIIYFQMGEFAASAEDCRRALQRMPQHYGALSGLGRCLMNLGRDAEALDAFRRAKRVNPNLNLDGAIEELKKRLDNGGGENENKGQAV